MIWIAFNKIQLNHQIIRSMLNSSSAEKHLIKIIVNIKTIRLLVRFPCKLTFHLKTQTGQAQSKNSYDLKKGECVVNETLELDTQIAFDSLTNQYEDKKVRLTIMMASTNGVIPAGTVSFTPCNKQNLEKVEYTLPLEKCPDRSAQVTFLQSYKFLRNNSPENHNIIHQQTGYRTSKVDLKYSSASNLYLINRDHQRKSPRDVSNNSKNQKLTPPQREVTPRTRLRTTTNVAQNYPSFKQNSYNEQEYQPQLTHSQVVQEEVFYTQQGVRSIDPNEKAYYLREINKLKGELKNVQSQDKWDQVLRLKEENQELMSQIEKIKEKLRSLERKEREYNMQIKEAKDDSERNRNKYLQAETLKNQYEVYIGERDRIIKDQQTEIKKLEEKIQDSGIAQNTQQKRIQFKENSFQEQLKKLNQKYSMSETERQKVTFDYNTLLAKMEESEKKHQNNFKEKERAFTEEKNKLSKKIEILTISLQKSKEQLSEKDVTLSQNLNQIKIFLRKESERQQKLTSTETQLQLASLSLKKQLEQRKVYEREIQNYKAIEEERNILKKKLNQNNIDLSKANEKIDRFSNELANNQIKIKEFQTVLAERNSQKQVLTNKFNSLKKDFDLLKKEEEKRTKQFENLSAQSLNAGQKVNDLRSKLETEKRDFQEMQQRYEEQLAYLLKSKEYSDNEIEQLKWSLDKSQEHSEDLSNRLKGVNDQMLKLNQQIMQDKEKIKRFEDETKELIANIQFLKVEKNTLEKKEKDLNEQLRNKNENNYDLQKKFQNLEQEVFITKEKLKQSETASKQKGSNDERNLKEKEKQITSKSEEITQLQLETMSKSDEISTLIQENNIKKNQIEYLKESVQNARTEINLRDVKLEESREELKISNNYLSNSNKELQTVKKSLQEQTKNLNKLKKEWDDYRRDTSKALQQLLDEISKDEDGSLANKHSLLVFPDMNLSTMQVQVIKKRNNLISKYNQRLLELHQLNTTQENQIKKVKKILAEKQEDFQLTLKKEKEKYKQSLLDFNREKQSLAEQLTLSHENNITLTTQLEKLNGKINKKDEFIQELTEQIEEITKERQNLRTQIKGAQQKLLMLKSSEIKFKAANQSKITEISSQKQSYLDKLKSSITDLQKKILQEEKSSREKDESIKKLEAKCNEITYERDRNQQKMIENHEKYINSSQEKKEVDKKVKNQEKEVKQLQLQVQSLKESLGNEKQKFQELQSRLNEMYGELSEAQVSNEKHRQQYDLATETIVELQVSLKEHSEKHKVITEKQQSQIKSLKEKIISLNSDIQLKAFLISQHQTQLSSQGESLHELKEDLAAKKIEIIKLNDKIQDFKNQQLYLNQSIEILKTQKDFLEGENQRNKDRIISLENEIAEIEISEDILEEKEKENMKLKEELETVRQGYQKRMTQMQNSQRRNANILSSRIGGKIDDQSKRKIKELEQILESRNLDLSLERKKIINEYDREKRILIHQNNQLTEKINHLQDQFDFQRAQLNKEIQSLIFEGEALSMKLLEKSELILAQEELIKSYQTPSSAEKISEHIDNVKQIFEKLQNSSSRKKAQRGEEEQIDHLGDGLGELDYQAQPEEEN